MVVLIEGQGATVYNDQTWVFRSSLENAFLKALEVGKAAEQKYLNGDGQIVAWKLVEILTLDYVGAEIADPKEVHSGFVDLPEGMVIPFETEFRPQESRPGMTI